MADPLYANVPPPPVGPPPSGLLVASRTLGFIRDGALPVVFEGYPTPDYMADVSQPEFAEQSPPDGNVPEARRAWHRVGGVSYEQRPCSGGGTYDPCDPDPVEVTSLGDPVYVAGFPIKVGSACSALDGYTVARLPELVADLLWVRQHYIAGREFWTGEQAQASGWDNPYLQNAATVTTVGYSLSTCGGLAALEDAIGNECSGGAAVIHASPALATAWARDFQVQRVGDVLYTTAQGTPVISGPGYLGTGPDYTDPTEESAGTTWAYATGLLDVRLGPAVRSEPIATNIDKDTNKVTVWGERLAQISWDGCCHLAVQIDLGDCSPEDGSGLPPA